MAESAPPPARMIYIIGAPRSGTTWLHRMLEQHPAIVSAPYEMTLLSRYLAPARDAFLREKGHIDRGDWKQGLPMIMTEAEFDDGLRTIAQQTYRRIQATKPGASWLLEKHPGYTYHLPLIEHLMPGGRYIHLIRDGRDTALSMLSARARVGFGAASMEEAAREWADSVKLARAHGRRIEASRYAEIRYEDLLADTAGGLRELLAFCDLDLDDAWCDRVAAEYRFDRKQVSRGDTSHNALREKPGAIWQARMGLRQRYVFDRVAGDWLKATGYGTDGWWSRSPLERALMVLYPMQLRLRRALAFGLKLLRAPAFKPVPRSEAPSR